jgi:hypothetical protein
MLRTALTGARFGAAMLLLVVGCKGAPAEDDEHDEHAPPGVLRFELRGISTPEAATPETPILAGATFTLVGIGDFTSALEVRSTDKTRAHVLSSRTGCRCLPATGVAPHADLADIAQPCGPSETRRCVVEVFGKAALAGDVRFEIVDPRGGVLDRADLAVRDVASLGFSVSVFPKLGENDETGKQKLTSHPAVVGPDGVHEVAFGSLFTIRPAPLDANGATLVCAEGCARFGTLEDGILSTSGSSPFSARAAAKGTTSVTLSSGAATTHAAIRVVD